jgi:hypothetical protein
MMKVKSDFQGAKATKNTQPSYISRAVSVVDAGLGRYQTKRDSLPSVKEFNRAFRKIGVNASSDDIDAARKEYAGMHGL